MKVKDSEIRLFGMKIGSPEKGKIRIVSGEKFETKDCEFVASGGVIEFESNCLEEKKVSRVVKREEAEKDLVDENREPVSESHENPKTPSIDEEPATPKTLNTGNDTSDDSNDSQDKTLKKPDKIIPCPRCNSMDTKFCYYNNYNVNQPRYFCKSCQRYWTSGGTMRSVPVGAGRRKNKNSASHCPQIAISEVLEGARIEIQNGINGTVLSFGSDGRPMTINGPTRNGFFKLDRGSLVSHNGGENGDDCSCGSAVTTSSSIEEGAKNGFQEQNFQNLNAIPSQIPCLPGIPWPYHMNFGFPMPFYPLPYYNFGLQGSWNGHQGNAPIFSPTSPKTNENSPNLGKHSREGDLIKPMNSEGKDPLERKDIERSVLIPKTLRIDNPEEAAKSSIWTTLGIKNEFKSKGSLFKAFQPKGDQKNHHTDPSAALLANPAAFSRSLSFQESC